LATFRAGRNVVSRAVVMAAAVEAATVVLAAGRLAPR